MLIGACILVYKLFLSPDMKETLQSFELACAREVKTEFILNL